MIDLLKQYQRSSYKDKIPNVIYKSSTEACKMVANQIADLIRTKQMTGQQAVLGLATGNTPLIVYRELRRLHEEEQLSFKNVTVFNLDEYYPIEKESLDSYWHFMHTQLFNYIDIVPTNIHIPPSGNIEHSDVEQYCQAYEEAIEAAGGIDFQLLGLGGNGHIGFNEPGSSSKSRTRLIALDRRTRSDAASGFFGIENVPHYAITMGVGTILKAKSIVIMAFSESKSSIVQRVIEGDISSQYPATYLQEHSDTLFVLDGASASQLISIRTPWLQQAQDKKLCYTPTMIKKAVVWLCSRVKKSILRLTYEDYEDNSLLDLVIQVGKGKAEAVNLVVFNWLRDTITGWPAGGRPDQGATTYYENKLSNNTQRIIVFSPHPDDDVICMGGTMRKLINQGHSVHVCYQVSGSLAVFDSDALRYADVISQVDSQSNLNHPQDSKTDLKNPNSKNNVGKSLYNLLQEQIQSKQPGDIDPLELRQIKTIIRRSEAKQAAMYVGVDHQNINFLDLPFYESGKAIKKPMNQYDIDIVKSYIQNIKPQIIYAGKANQIIIEAGDLTDPHGTHRICLQVILAALDQLKDHTTVFLYRGAWQEWEIEKITKAIPLSPEEVHQKRIAIFKHQTQKDRPMYPGSDSREFWQRTEQRNRQTAESFTSLGFVNYEAIECFALLDDLRKSGEL